MHFLFKNRKKTKRRKPALDSQEEREDLRNRLACANRNFLIGMQNTENVLKILSLFRIEEKACCT